MTNADIHLPTPHGLTSWKSDRRLVVLAAYEKSDAEAVRPGHQTSESAVGQVAASSVLRATGRGGWWWRHDAPAGRRHARRSARQETVRHGDSRPVHRGEYPAHVSETGREMASERFVYKKTLRICLLEQYVSGKIALRVPVHAHLISVGGCVTGRRQTVTGGGT